MSYDDIKSYRKPGLQPLSLEDTFLEKPQCMGGAELGGRIDPAV